jgi:hypothetical protein
MENLWWLMDVVGPILLIAVIVWVWLRNRRARGSSVQQAERGAVKLREELDREDNP